MAHCELLFGQSILPSCTQSFWAGSPLHCETNNLLMFQEIEEDPDVRSRIALYKDPSAMNIPRVKDDDQMSEDDSDDEVLNIPFEELLDDLTNVEL